MDLLLKLAHTPPVTVGPHDSVQDAVTTMSRNRVGAVGVVEGEKLIGIFTERDVMERVVMHKKDAEETKIHDVMTAPVERAQATDDPTAALERMVAKHIRHLPVTDSDDRLLGILSIRNVLQHQLEKTKDEANALEAYISADGPGG